MDDALMFHVLAVGMIATGIVYYTYWLIRLMFVTGTLVFKLLPINEADLVDRKRNTTPITGGQRIMMIALWVGIIILALMLVTV
jgi:hypothetical protein